jgi:pimeloyl-ACP methyl ester carboxylesterase
MGFRTIAPDMRGYGRSSVYPQHGDYDQAHIVQDMIDLVDAVGREEGRLGRS